MSTSLLSLAFAFLVAPVAIAPPMDALPCPTQESTPDPVAAPAATVDPALAAPRAESLGSRAPLSELERSALVAAQADAPDLVALRAGSAPDDSELGWFVVGAGIVLLIILI